MNNVKELYIEYLVEETNKKFANQESKINKKEDKIERLLEEEKQRAKQEYYCY